MKSFRYICSTRWERVSTLWRSVPTTQGEKGNGKGVKEGYDYFGASDSTLTLTLGGTTPTRSSKDANFSTV